MKLKELLAYNIPFQEKSDWDVIYNLLEHFDLSYDLNGMIDSMTLIQTKRVYDVPHDSDEACYLYLIYLNGEFVAKMSKDGDRSHVDTTFYDMGESKLSEYIHSFLDMSEAEGSLEDDAFHHQQYIYPIHCTETNQLYYRVNSPKWSYSFRKGVNVFVKKDMMIPAIFMKYVIDDRRQSDKEELCLVTLGEDPDKAELADVIQISAKDLYFKMI
jgi:hypothetical protein